MKKFYALMAAGITVFGASAINPTVGIPSKAESMKIHNETLKAVETPATRISGLEDMAFSRADEEVDFEPATFTQMLFYDYFVNWTNSDGTKASSFRYLENGAEVGLTQNEDGSISIDGLCGYNFACTMKYNDETGAFYFELGEVVLETDSYVFKLASYDFDNEAVITEGALDSYGVYTNAIVFGNVFVGAYAYNKTTGKAAGWGAIFYIDMFIQPNATLSYSVDLKNSQTGEYETVDFNNKIYAEYWEADLEEDPNALDGIFLSNVTYFNDGLCVQFDYYMETWMASDQIAMPTAETSTGEYTGDYYIYGIKTVDGMAYMDDTIVIAGETDNGLIWPVENAELDFTDDAWGIVSKSGYGFICTPATLTFGIEEEGEGDTDGIKDVQLTEDVNAPAVYYNIQGMEVANPVAGQIYIVKQGNKVSKQVIR